MADSRLIENLPRPLLWTSIRFEPRIFFILEAVSGKMQTQLTGDVNYIQYFLEEAGE